jgi:hypothetical protein
LPSCGAGFGAHGSTLFDHFEGCSDNGALVLDCAAGTLLSYFLLRMSAGDSQNSEREWRGDYGHNAMRWSTALPCIIHLHVATNSPPKYPSCAISCKASSKQFASGSCAEETSSRSCHSGT